MLDVVEANNTVYAVLENPGGIPLDQWLDKQKKNVTPEAACAMLQPVFNGVAAMHQVGLVHRGICPENIRVAGQRPGPADRLRHHRPADRGQRPPRPAVRGLLRPRAVFGGGV